MKINPFAYLIYRVERWFRESPSKMDMGGLAGLLVLCCVAWCYFALSMWFVERLSGLPVVGLTTVFPYEMHYTTRTVILFPFYYCFWWLLSKRVDFDALMAYYEKETEEERKRRTLPLWLFSLGPYVMLFVTATWDKFYP
jgi:hypothetical protein